MNLTKEEMLEPDIDTVLVFNEVGQKIPMKLITPLYSSDAVSAIEQKHIEYENHLRTKLAEQEQRHLQDRAKEQKYQEENARLQQQVSDATTMWTEQCAENKKYQAQIVMLVGAATVICEKYRISADGPNGHGLTNNDFFNLRDAVLATQATAEAWEREVKARAQQEVLEELSDFFADAIQGDFENGVKSLNERECAEFKRRFPTIWDGIGKVNAMLDAAELRNQDKQPCTCDGRCDGFCLKQERLNP